MAKKKSRKQDSLIIKCLKFPVWLLTQALTVSGGQATYGNTMGCPTPLPRSFSTKSDVSNGEEKYNDHFMRVSSARKNDGELYRSKSTPNGVGVGVAPPVKRSNTVAIGRIDEDRTFGDDGVGLLKSGSRSRGGYGFTRSKSRNGQVRIVEGLVLNYSVYFYVTCDACIGGLIVYGVFASSVETDYVK